MPNTLFIVPRIRDTFNLGFCFKAGCTYCKLLWRKAPAKLVNF